MFFNLFLGVKVQFQGDKIRSELLGRPISRNFPDMVNIDEFVRKIRILLFCYEAQWRNRGKKRNFFCKISRFPKNVSYRVFNIFTCSYGVQNDKFMF